jgi:hypothetical protein
LDEAQTLGCLEVDLKKQEGFNAVSLVEPVGRCDNYSESRMRNYRFEYCIWVAVIILNNLAKNCYHFSQGAFGE